MIKKAIVFSLLLLTGLTSFAQSVNDVPISEIDVEYIQIVGASKFMSNKVTIEIDFGQNSKFFNFGKETLVKDAEGKQMKFNSMIDALNFLSSNGYDIVQAYAFVAGTQNIHHYIMRKRKGSE